MKRRRQIQSSALSFIDCICCGFGAVLLLFILTAKKQMNQEATDSRQTLEALEILQREISVSKAEQQTINAKLASLDPQPDVKATDLTQLNDQLANLSKAIETKNAALAYLDEETKATEAIAGKDRPSADRSYLSGLRLQGPRVLILLENSGSMLAENANSALEIIRSGNGNQSEKWLRAKAAVRAVLAAIPKNTKVAILQMNQQTTPLTGTLENPYIDPYNNTELIDLSDRLEGLEASGGANLLNALITVRNLKDRPSSLLLIGDGLPTAPNPTGRTLSESNRVKLFHNAMAARPNFPFNVLLLPFEGDPSAAGLFWKLSSRTNGITLIPNKDWPNL